MRRPRPCSRRPRGCSPSSSCAPATPRPCTRPAGRPAAWSRRRASGSPRPSARGRARSSGPRGGTEADNLAVKGLVLGPTQRGPAPPTPARVRRRAPRGARPGVLDGRARGRGAGAAARRRATASLDVDALRDGARAQRRPGRADLRDVGQQRGRHAAAARRRGRARPPVRRPRARRRGAGRRPGAGRLRRVGPRRDDRQRAQGRRPGRRRRAAGPARARPDARAARRRAGARRAVRHARRRPARVVRAGGRASRSRGREDFAAARRGAARRPGRRASRPPSPTRCCADRGTPSRRLPANAHFTFPGCEGDSLLTCSTPRGSRRRPGRRARRACRGRATCCWRWASTRSRRAARCGSASGTRRPPPTSTRCSRRLPGVVDRARAAGLATVGSVA